MLALKKNKIANSSVAILLVAIMLTGACTTVAAETPTVTVTKNQTVTVTTTTAAASTTTPVNTAVVPTTVAPPPTTKAVNWPMQITGQFTVSPKNAPIGGTATASGTGFAANAKFDLMWQDVTGAWDVKGGEFYGRVYSERWLNLGPIQTDAQGAFSVKFTVPEGYGFNHDLVVLEGGTANGTMRGKLAFSVDPQFTLETTSGPVGSPITIKINGMGWKEYENSWMVLYDNKYTGILTTVTTHGIGKATIPATGGIGKHIIQVIPGSFTFAFMNVAQGPYPKPTFTLSYTIVDGPVVMPPEFSKQSNPVVKATAPAANGKAQIWSDIYLAPVGTSMNIFGRGLPAGSKVDLYYWGMTGNRVSNGYQQVKVAVGTTTVSSTGEINFAYKMPDTHGGEHILFAEIAGLSVAETVFNLTPSAVSITPSSGQVGTIMDIMLKGLGWTVTENNYYMVVDNAYLGYTCGFNNYGTVNDFLPMAGAPGWHFVDFYPGIYRGTEPGKVEQYRLPILTYTDHPGEQIPVLRFAYFITG